MVRRQLTRQDDNVFTATGTIKGRSIRVSLLPAISTAQMQATDAFGRLMFPPGRVWKKPPDDITEPVPVPGTLLPRRCMAEGFGIDVTFDVGLRKFPGKHGQTQALDITHLSIGTPHEDPGEWVVAKPVDPAIISRPGLLRLAIKAARCVAIAYPAGWTIDEAENYVGTFGIGDLLPEDFSGTIFGASAKNDSKEHRERVVRLDSQPTIVPSNAGGDVDETWVRLLLGQRLPGRRRAPGSMTDPKMLKLVARLYKDAETKRMAGQSRPAYVRQRLIERNQYVSESWVRAVGVNARNAGFLQLGKRNRRSTGGRE